MSEVTIMGQQTQADNTIWMLIFSSWLIATIATLSAMFLSDVMGLVPCVLCWYQRIFLFPLVIILFFGLFPPDKNVVKYALPVAVVGLLFTIYHSLLFFGFIPENLQPCSQGVSCSDDSMVLFGFVPIPLLSLATFAMIIILLLITKTKANE